MGKAYVYVGTNSLRGSQGIYTLSLDTQSGKMEVIDTAAARDSAYLCLSRDGRRLYAVMESLEYEGKKGGGVASYQIEDGHLTQNGQAYAGGGWPCHISFGPAEREVYVSVFRNGSWMIFPVDRAGRLLEAAGKFHYSDPNGRQSHVHAAMLDPAGKYIAVADCGLDAVYLYGATSHDQVWREEFPEDTGPRQLAFSRDGKYLYLVTETSCELYVMRYTPEEKEKLHVIQVVSTQRCDGYEGRNYAGGLHFHPSGKYLLATNRGHNSFAVFGVDRENGMVRLLGHKMLAGDHCREFAFTSDGKMLVAGLQHTDKIQSFFFDEKTGRIFDTGYTLDIPSPSAVVIFEKEMQE